MASPANAVLALGATSLLPLTQPVGGLFLAAIWVARGVRFATICASLAAGVLVLFTALFGSSPVMVIGMILAGWLPVYLLMVIWQATRSTMLALQVSLIIAAVALLVFNLAVADLDAFWRPILEVVDEGYREAGLSSPLAALEQLVANSPFSVGEMMTMTLAVVSWLLAALEFQLGGALGAKAPGETGQFGRFQAVDFGRVLALALAIVAALFVLAGATVMGQVSMLLLAGFMLQGLAVVHWLHGEGFVPLMVVFLTYVTMLIVQDYALMALAIVGVLDAMLRLRRRLIESKGSEQ